MTPPKQKSGHAQKSGAAPKWGVLLAVCLMLWPATPPSPAMAAEGEFSSLVIVTDAGPQVFSVEVADTRQMRSKGLMFREYLAPERGMLFVYARSTRITMWMKNTLISLDMIFIDASGRIRNIGENTVPMSEKIVASEGKVHAVLELAAGTVARLGIKPGDLVSHAALD